jgi:hypothetical protein
MKKGYKPKICSGRICFNCDSTPPTLSNTIIKSLVLTFGQMTSKKLFDAFLAGKRKEGEGDKQENARPAGVIGTKKNTTSKAIKMTTCRTNAKGHKNNPQSQDVTLEKKKHKKEAAHLGPLEEATLGWWIPSFCCLPLFFCYFA